ncbi:MAG TPA: PEGA domain-containing protein [Bacteroidota bacterium]|nr:PEGA domain-containing protein [Bacteroidota bacterium]
MRVLPFAVAALVGTGVAAAGVPDSTRASLTVETPRRRALVIVDSSMKGYTPLTIDTLVAGMHEVRLLALPVTRWAEGPVFDTVSLRQGEHRTLEYALPPTFRLSSAPSGATAWKGATSLGVTPLTLPMKSVLPGDSLILRENGFEEAMVTVPDTLHNDLMVPLRRLWAPEALSEPMEVAKNGEQTSIHLLGPIAGAVIAGTISAFCKIHADDVNNQYLATGDGTLLREVRRYDLLSAITLVVAETGMALLAYFLLNP